MKVIYGGEALDCFSSDGNIYLAGANSNHWKEDAISCLEDLQFDGNVYLSNKKDEVDEIKDFAWKNSVAKNCESIVLWNDFEVSMRMRLAKMTSSYTICGSFKDREFHTVQALMKRALQFMPNQKENSVVKVKRYLSHK